ncbi:MAG: methyltransferase domain-containing protein [Luteitalea sp.]|nr:methyltransferase domain-containing protein [Luteitalea sp.]
MAGGHRLTIAGHYDAELRQHNARLRAATAIGPGDRVLDVGCGAGQSTRDAARAAVSGSVLGVDVSEQMLERARRLTAEEGLHNVTYELGDVQVHRFAPEHFDVVISRFGTMFFAAPVAALTNVARASRPGARLVMMVWQSHDRNEWATAIHRSLTAGSAMPAQPPSGQDPFSLADPSTVEAILAGAGFTEVGFADVHVPVYYGPDVAAAYDIVCSMKSTNDMLAELDAAPAERALERLRAILAAHHTGHGVMFDSRAWIVTARRRGPTA